MFLLSSKYCTLFLFFLATSFYEICKYLWPTKTNFTQTTKVCGHFFPISENLKSMLQHTMIF